MAGLSIIVDREVCIGSGMCVTYAPHTFEQDDEAKSVVVDTTTDDADVIRSAVEACPMGALHIVENASQE